MIAFAPLLAALEDILRLVVPIIFVVFWIISQISGNRQGKAARGRGPMNPPADPDAPEQVDLRKEIERFLKQASGGKDPAERAEIAEELEAPPRRRRRLESPVEAEVLAEPALANQASARRLTTRHAVSSHVQQHLGTHEVSDHAARLSDDLAQTDERLEARLHAKFDHSLGQLQQTASQEKTEDTGPSMADEIVDVFRNPQEVRRAIILNEILSRPEDRW